METELAKHDLGTIPVYLLHSFIIPLSSNVVPLSHRPYFSQWRRPSLSLRSLSVTGAPHVPHRQGKFFKLYFIVLLVINNWVCLLIIF